MPRSQRGIRHGTFNELSVQQFNAANAEIDQDAISKHFDIHLARLCTHLDLQVIRRQILPRLVPKLTTILDVGAGKGRMTRHLAQLGKVVALEPYSSSYEILTKRLPSVEAYPLTLADYAASAANRFELIYLGGVLPHLESGEATELLRTAKRLLNPGGFIYLHDYGKEDGTDAKQKDLILRSPSEIQVIFKKAGIVCAYQLRAYPPNAFWALVNFYPNRVTKSVWKLASSRATFPLWQLLAGLNLAHKRTSYFFYIMRA